MCLNPFKLKTQKYAENNFYYMPNKFGFYAS